MTRFVILLIALFSFTEIMNAQNGGEPVIINPTGGPGGNGSGNQGGSKAPAHYDLPLQAWYYSDSNLLEFLAEDNLSFSYSVYDDEGELLLQDTLYLESDEKVLLQLPATIDNLYLIRITCGGITFEGRF